MKNRKFTKSIMALVAIAALATTTLAKDFEPEYVGGYPTKETAEAMFEEYDYQAAVQFFIWAYPYLNSMGLEKGFAAMGGDERSTYTFDKTVQPQHIMMTANSQVIYTWTRFFDVSKGPVVCEVPPRVRGHIYDMGMRAYSDTGDLGPDKSKGGKYLIVSGDYDDEIPQGYYVVRATHSDRVTCPVRTFPTSEGGIEGAVKLAGQLKWYYLSEADNPPENSRVLIGDKPWSQEWPRDENAFEWLAEVFNMDKVPATALAHMGNMRRLGVEKGKPFNPDERAKRILKRAAKTAEAMVLSMCYDSREDVEVYDNRQWGKYFFTRNPDFLNKGDDGQPIYEEVEQRAGTWHQVNGNFFNPVPPTPGTGGFYVLSFRDKDGNLLMGQNTYRLRVPAEVPVKQFWQIPVYEAATRSMIANGQRSTLTGTDDLKRNRDGSVDIYFAPELPKGVSEKNWIKTKAGEGWFAMPRLYAPLKPILDKTWRWNDIEKIK